MSAGVLFTALVGGGVLGFAFEPYTPTFWWAVTLMFIGFIGGHRAGWDAS